MPRTSRPSPPASRFASEPKGLSDDQAATEASGVTGSPTDSAMAGWTTWRPQMLMPRASGEFSRATAAGPLAASSRTVRVGVLTTVPPGFVPTALDIQASQTDRQFPRDIHNIGNCMTLLTKRLLRTFESEQSASQKAAMPLLTNALTTVGAALEIWRRGMLLPVGILLRNALELVATVAVITHDKQAYERYERGEYKSTTAFTDVRKAWPYIGGEIAKIAGFLSNEFVHVGVTSRSVVVSP
jgi:hypothetical protein